MASEFDKLVQSKLQQRRNMSSGIPGLSAGQPEDGATGGDFRDLLIRLSRAYQANAPTEAQRGYVPPIERIFDPQIAALSGSPAPGPIAPDDFRLSEDELYAQYAPDFNLYLGSDPSSLEAKAAANIYNKKPLSFVFQQIRAGYNDEVTRLQDQGLSSDSLPTLEEYLEIASGLYKDFKTVQTEASKQERAWKKAQSDYEKELKQSDVFYKAGLPSPEEQFNVRELFPEQFKTITKRLEERIPLPTAKLPSGQRAAIPAMVEGRVPVPSQAQISPAQKQQRDDALKLREQVQAELDKIVQSKLAQAGFTPLGLEATRRLSIGR